MSDRRAIEIPGFAHRNPVPAASRIGQFVASGVLTGRDPVTREMPASLDAQCANAFGHVRQVMAVAGGSIDDIIKITVHLAEYRDRAALNREWVAMFPDAGTRPTRQVLKAELDEGQLIQMDLLAVLP